jgi:hypothetical protein
MQHRIVKEITMIDISLTLRGSEALARLRSNVSLKSRAGIHSSADLTSVLFCQKRTQIQSIISRFFMSRFALFFHVDAKAATNVHSKDAVQLDAPAPLALKHREESGFRPGARICRKPTCDSVFQRRHVGRRSWLFAGECEG